MHFSLLYVGEKPNAWAEQACEQFVKRLPAQSQFSLTRIAPARRSKNTVTKTARTEEWQRVLEKAAKNSLLVLLDERGKQLTSIDFAEQIDSWQHAGQDITFIIAGADGVNDEDRKAVDFLLALSHLTLPHELARVLFIEQVYRAWTILTNHPYHRV